MNKKIASLLLCCLLLSQLGCHAQSDPAEDPILFYYPRSISHYEFGSTDGVISWEERDPAGHRNNLRYLLTLYLLGPVDEHLTSPFPEGCQIIDLNRSETHVTITLNANFATLKEMDLTLACVSLAQTCFSLTEVQTVRILCETSDGQTAIDETITRQQLLTEDISLPAESSN